MVPLAGLLVTQSLDLLLAMDNQAQQESYRADEKRIRFVQPTRWWNEKSETQVHVGREVFESCNHENGSTIITNTNVE